MDGSAESNDAAAGHLSMTKEKSRAPECIRKRLLAALDKIAKGPSCDPFFGTDGFREGFKERGVREAIWRATWIEPELRQVLAWIDGAETATGIEIYGRGRDYAGRNQIGEPEVDGA